MDLKEQQNIIDSVNHIGRIVKRYASCNIGLRAFGAKAVGMPNHVQLGNFFTIINIFWTHLGQLGELLGQFVAFLGQFVAHCVSIGAIVTLFGQSWIF